MKKMYTLAVLLTAAISAPAWAAETDPGLVDNRTLSLGTALSAAQSALKSCQDKGYQVAVSVVDRGGNVQVLLKDRFAGTHTPDTAIRKAWTAVSFRTGTSELVDLIKAGDIPQGLHNVTRALIVGGGLKVEAAGSIVGGIGVSGAPADSEDDKCAQAGIDAIADVLDF